MKKKLVKISLFYKILFNFLILITIFLIYSHYEYTKIQVRNIVLKSSDIPEEFNGKKILFLADFQVDTIGRYNKKQMDRIISLVNSQEKDVILMGGDYVNWTGKIERFYKQLKKLKKPEYGVYVVLGNHDYVDIDRTIENLKKLDYKVLRNENEMITINDKKIYISGVEDLWKGIPNAKRAVAGIEKEDFNILISHNPEYFEDIDIETKEKIDITLSGHTHGGQITFFGKIVKAPIKNLKKYGYVGLKEFGENKDKLYITSGVGGAAFEMFIRFFAKPEIVVFELEKISKTTIK